MKCCQYTAGMLREPVTFERLTSTPDGAGGFTEGWAAVSGAPTKAMARQSGGSERVHGARVEAVARLRVVVRYFPGLLESDRVLMRSKYHNIRSINNVDFADKWLEIGLDGGVAS